MRPGCLSAQARSRAPVGAPRGQSSAATQLHRTGSPSETGTAGDPGLLDLRVVLAVPRPSRAEINLELAVVLGVVPADLLGLAAVLAVELHRAVFDAAALLRVDRSLERRLSVRELVLELREHG